MNINIPEINTKLKKYYGCNLRGEPIFRLAFSDTLKESRIGTFCEYYGKIFLREFSGVQQVPKYSYLKGVWVLEKWIPPVLAHDPEIPATSQGSYEPVYAFRGPNGEKLPVLEIIVLQIIYKLFHPDMPGDRESKLRTEYENQLKREIDWNKLVLEEEGRTWMGHQLHSGEAVTKL